jgi:hypothetical protein
VSVKFLHQIRSRYSRKELVANQFLTISKPTPENLAAYDFPLRNLDSFHQFLLFGFYSIRTSLILVKENLFFRKSEDTPNKFVESLFVSHFFSNYLNRTFDSDPFFGRLPGISRHTGGKSATIYIDQESRRFKGRTIANDSGTSFRIIGISSPDLGYASLFIKNVLLAIFLFRDGLRISNKIYRSIQLRVAVSQISIATVRNQVISREIAREIKSKKVRELWLTLEGHAYERAIISTICSDNHNVRINLYQHAAITPGQMGIFELLKEFGSQVHVFTSGRITYDYFAKHFPNLIENLHIAGSTKAIDATYLRRIPEDKNRKFLLFVPEGTEESTLSMVRLATGFAEGKNFLKPLIRFHPNTPQAAIDSSLILLKHSSVEVSALDLSEDFKRSRACVYRTSATVIESLAYGVLPVYFTFKDDLDLDCLSLGALSYPRVDTAQSLIDLIRGSEIRFSSKLFSPLEDFKNFSAEYFMPWVDSL